MAIDKKYTFLFILLGALFFLPFLGGVHLFDWDEINFAEAAREMLLLEDYLQVHINFEPFFQKPPLFIWLQVLSMKLFGVNEFAARFPNALCGMITLPLLYHIGRRLYHHRMGVLWAGAYFGSVLPFLYFKSGIIDPFFNLFIFLGLYFFILFYWKKDGREQLELKYSKWFYLVFAGIFAGLGILTKGPVAYLVIGLVLFVYWFFQRFRFFVSIPQFLLFSFIAILVTGGWFGLEILQNGPGFVMEFLKYQYRLLSTEDAGHGGFPGYHFVVLLVGCFPASTFVIRSFFKMKKKESGFQLDFQLWMKILFWVVLILFSLVQSKIIHYSSLAYFPLTFLAARTIDHIISGDIKFTAWMKGLLFGVGALYIFVSGALPFAGNNIHKIKSLFDDPFAQANMDASVNWTYFDLFPAVYLLILIWLFFFLIKRQQLKQSFKVLFGGTAVFSMLALLFFVGKIETYSQRAAVEFFESKAGEDCYIITHGYKSYAHLFYAKKQVLDNPKSYDKAWLLKGDIDKDVYVTCKIHRTAELEKVSGLEEIGRKNGFVFFKREAGRGGD